MAVTLLIDLFTIAIATGGSEPRASVGAAAASLAPHASFAASAAVPAAVHAAAGTPLASAVASRTHRIRVRHARQSAVDAQQSLQHKAWISAELAETSQTGKMRRQVIGRCTIREALLAADCSEQCSTDAPTSADEFVMRAFVTSLRLDDGWQRRPVMLDSRRCSLAGELMQECELVARSWGYDETWLHVYASNEAAVRLYVDELGYEIMSQQTAPRGPRGGLLTAFCMRKMLDASAPADGLSTPLSDSAEWRGCEGRAGPRLFVL